jgi:hypothetical protein
MSSCVQWDCSESNGSFYCPPRKCAHYTWAKAWSTQSNLLYRYLLWQFDSMDINVMKHKINGYSISMKSCKTWYLLQFIMNIKNTVIFYLVGSQFIHMVIFFFEMHMVIVGVLCHHIRTQFIFFSWHFFYFCIADIKVCCPKRAAACKKSQMTLSPSVTWWTLL